MNDTRIINPNLAESDALENNIRPQYLNNYLGQVMVKEHLRIFIDAAKNRGEALDHVLLFGPPGLGKTTLANIIANEMGAQIKQTTGPILEKPGDLAAILTNLEPNHILFIDEIHRLSAVVEETLYSAMEDYQLDILLGDGPSARSIKLDLPRFTLIGATTRAGLLTSPLRDRFGIIERLQFYTVKELTLIVMRSAKILDIKIDLQGAAEIACRSRGTPRIANRLLKRVRDFAQVKNNFTIDYQTASEALNLLEVDKAGFDILDRQLLLTIIDKFSGGPVGLESLAAALGEEKGTIEDIIEPYLIQQGYINRTARGRIATALSYKHFGLELPQT